VTQWQRSGERINFSPGTARLKVGQIDCAAERNLPQRGCSTEKIFLNQTYDHDSSIASILTSAKLACEVRSKGF